MWSSFISTVLTNPLAIKETHLIMEIINFYTTILGTFMTCWVWLVNQMTWAPSSLMNVGPTILVGMKSLIELFGSGLFIIWTKYVGLIQWSITPSIPYVGSVIEPITGKMAGGIGLYLVYLLVRWFFGI